MRHHAHSSQAPQTGVPVKQRPDRETLKQLFPYLWQYKWRVLMALTFMVGAKVANVSVPILLKNLIDDMSIKPGDPQAVLVVPVALLLVYGALRLSVSAFTELRELVFAKATQGAARQIALETFQHLHGLSLRFHLERQTGGMTRDIERGVRGIESLISYSLYSVVPTLIEVALVLSILAVKFDVWFAGITLAALALYTVLTISVTEWRTRYRRRMNELDSAAHTRAVDSLLNYETVKYFNNEAFEASRYDKSLEALRRARLKAQTSLSLLNTGQQLIIAVALVGMLWRATQGVVDGRMTLGDLVMINAFMIQLYIPLNFLGVLYREIKQSLTDLDRMFTLLEKEREVADSPNAPTLLLSGPPTVKFESVVFAYDPARTILHGISFEIPAGKTVAVVGPSGSGLRARASPRWHACCFAFTTWVRGRSPSTVKTFAKSRKAACAEPWASCRKTRCCSTTPCVTTSPMAARMRARPRWSKRLVRRIFMTSSSRHRRATTRWSASAASSSQGVKNNAWPLRVPC